MNDEKKKFFRSHLPNLPESRWLPPANHFQATANFRKKNRQFLKLFPITGTQ
jgi:hypothetical protein